MPEKRVETGDVSFLYTEVNDRQEIKDIVFSPDMTYMVTSDNKVYEMWTIDDDGNDDDGNYDDENDDDENDDDKNDDKNDDYEIDEMIIKIYDNVFIVPDKNTEKLYNNSKLSIYSRFKEIKEIKNYYKESVKINKNEKEIRVVGKKLRWVFSELNNLLSVFNKTKYLKGVKGNYPLAVKKLVQLDLKPYELKILDDHDTEGSEVLSKKVETKIEKSNSEGCEILLKKFEDLEAKFKPLLDHIALEINNE
ncbi:19773_t:CDS:2 [Funneliformis geosporum]|uniref:19773_t:CDS:1 n=1 Tax=Funneliformis geosporum TaxID=1117311 RepID=A0A9W4SEP8_9GLOM|nr:19773_t:CDS:2 [Funneliformis geosporum]